MILKEFVDKSYFRYVAKELSTLLDRKVILQKYDERDTSRTITFFTDDGEIVIDHIWRKGGSKNNPITQIILQGESKNAGRLQIDQDPKDYAFNLADLIKTSEEAKLGVSVMIEKLEKLTNKKIKLL